MLPVIIKTSVSFFLPKEDFSPLKENYSKCNYGEKKNT